MCIIPGTFWLPGRFTVVTGPMKTAPGFSIDKFGTCTSVCGWLGLALDDWWLAWCCWRSGSTSDDR